MELESLKRQLKCLEDNKAQVTKLVTDRHTQVSAYMANEKPDIEHAYDVWHVAKGTQPPQDIKWSQAMLYDKILLHIETQVRI